MEVGPLWRFDVTAASENRRGPRTAIPDQFATSLVGVDGNEEGGLRPSSGFVAVVELEHGYGDDAALAADGGEDQGGEMKGFFPVTFRVDATKYAYGFVYRVLNDDGDKAAYHVKLRIGSDLTWHTTPSLGNTGGLIAAEAYAGEQFHVQVTGRFVYCLREGLRPFRFFIEEPTPGNYSLNVDDETGPGLAPVLRNPTKNSASADITAGAGRTADQDVAEMLPTLAPPADGDSEGRIVYWGFSGLSKVSADGINFITNPNLYVRNPPNAGGVVDENIKGPSETGLWATPPQPDPTFANVVWYVNGTPATPNYPVPPGGPQDEFFGWAYEEGANQELTPRGFTDPDFVWAYRLWDSRTGRYSPLSNRLRSGQDGYGATAVKAVTGTDNNGQQVTSLTPVTFPMIQVVYDKTRYDTILVYRGRLQQGVDESETIMSLEATLTMADYHVDTQPVDTDWGLMAYFPVLSDSELSQQQTFIGDDVFNAEMPHAGSAIFYEGTMLMGKLGSIDDELGGLGKAVWSSLSEMSVELVSPTARYPLQLPDEEVDRFCRLGPNVLGLSRISQYLFRREINYLKAQPMHMGFGCPGPRAAAEVGSTVFFITEHGLHSVASNGAMDDVSVINQIIQREWAGELEQVEMAFDPPSGALFILNPVQEQTVVMWMRNGRVSEFHDTVFTHVTEGDIPFEPEVEGSRLQRRAVFVQYIQTGVSTKRWRVFVYDYNRQKTDHVTLLDFTGDTIYQASQAKAQGATVVKVGTPTAVDAEGAYLYVLSGPYAGEKVRIVYRSSTTEWVVEALPFPLALNTYLGLSPVFLEWVSPLLGLKEESGFEFGTRDFHRIRHVEGVRAAFTGVNLIMAESGHDEALARYQGVVIRGTDEEPLDKRYPVGTQQEDVQSIEDGITTYAAAFGDPSAASTDPKMGVQGNAMFGGVRIFIPDVDYRLLGVDVVGMIRDQDSMAQRG